MSCSSMQGEKKLKTLPESHIFEIHSRFLRRNSAKIIYERRLHKKGNSFFFFFFFSLSILCSTERSRGRGWPSHIALIWVGIRCKSAPCFILPYRDVWSNFSYLVSGWSKMDREPWFSMNQEIILLRSLLVHHVSNDPITWGPKNTMY